MAAAQNRTELWQNMRTIFFGNPWATLAFFAAGFVCGVVFV